MKLTYYQLTPHLSKNLCPIYIISGEELFLQQEAMVMIREAAQKAGFVQRNRLTAEATIETEQLYNALNSASLFCEKQLIELSLRELNLNKTTTNILHDYAKNPSPQQLLLISADKLENKLTKNSWFTALEQAGAWIPIWPITRDQLPQWIQQYAKKYRLSFHPEASKILTEYVEGNLIVAAQTIEKLHLLQPQKMIDEALIHEIMSDENHFSIFDFLESFVAGNLSRMLHILTVLKNEDTEPTLVLWGITRELRLLADCALQRKQGIPLETLFQKHKIFSRRQAAIRHSLTRLSCEDCYHYLAYAADLDLTIKGARPGNIWDQLQIFLMRVWG